MENRIIENTEIFEEALPKGVAYVQEILFCIDNHKFKISIRSESLARNSFANLEKWLENYGFSSILDKNPQLNYGIYQPVEGQEIKQDAFEPILTDLIRIATKFAT